MYTIYLRAVRTLLAVSAVSTATLVCAAVASSKPWAWPLKGRVLTEFKRPPMPYSPGGHQGIDIGGRVGSPVRSACDGDVTFAGSVGSSGTTLTVQCGQYLASYLHLSRVTVAEGEAVSKGDVIASVGQSGTPSVSQPHLHFGVRKVSDHSYLDPQELLDSGESVGPSVVPAAPIKVRELPRSPRPSPVRQRPRFSVQPRPLPQTFYYPAGVRGTQLPATLVVGAGLSVLSLLFGVLTAARNWYFQRRREFSPRSVSALKEESC